MNLKKLKAYSLIYLLIGILSSACLDEGGPKRAINNITEEDNNTPTNQDSNLPAVNYFYLNNTASQGTLSLFSSYDDSFLIRGQNVSDYLSGVTDPYSKTYCLVTVFPNAPISQKKYLALHAKVNSYKNPFTHLYEFYYQVFPNDLTANKNNCENAAAIKFLLSPPAPITDSVSFTISEVAPNYNLDLSSEKIEIISENGQKVSFLQTNHLNFRINFTEDNSNDHSQNMCSSNSACESQGFNCCLQGQCVNHGETKPGKNLVPGYSDILAAVTNSPSLILNYQDIFYVCPSMVPENPINNPEPEIDPEIEAAERVKKLGHLHDCLNQVQDEFSICTIKYETKGLTYPVYTPTDDLTIYKNGHNINPIVEVELDNTLLYKQKLHEGESEVTTSNVLFGANLDSQINNIFNPDALTNKSSVSIQNILGDELFIRYKVDGSCEKLGASLVRCSKTYKQGQNITDPEMPSNHSSSSQSFELPSYAEITGSVAVTVFVNDSIISQGTDTWLAEVVGNKKYITFQTSNYVKNNQTVQIFYYVTDSNLINKLLTSRQEAQAEVNAICSCSDNCNLKPKYDSNNTIINYECTYGEGDSGGPLQEVVYLSAKTAPHKFYDENGTYYDPDKIPASSYQEYSVNDTAGRFYYKNQDPLKPENQGDFNEIYGSFKETETSPVPASVVNVEKGKSYEIFTDEGAFSPCLNCGTDLYNSMAKLFPTNFTYKGGGYFPDLVEARRKESQSKYPADDMLFGRACFVPATMIPWSHQAKSNLKTQRQERLRAQHFLFANGYNRDWYGFDYGSVIGSFDGMAWFAIGNQRKITAKSNKLYLAINAYYGDLTSNNNFKVIVNETAGIINSGSSVTSNLYSDGAECQRAHICSTDNDCAATLGPDYSCENVSSLRTPWPQFDINGNEIANTSLDLSLSSIVGGLDGVNKRCVYRGRGALCEGNSQSANASATYSKTNTPGHLSCSLNNYCESIGTAGKFNTKIARFALSIPNQNVTLTNKSDLFGLGARILGRPFDFFGTSNAPLGLNINTQSICIPGKETQNISNTEDLNKRRPASRKADKMFNNGITKENVYQMDLGLYNSCTAVDASGAYLHEKNLSLNSLEYKGFTVAQNISTKLLDLPVLEDLNLYNDQESTITKLGFGQNTCLKAAGSACFTDLDCGPSQDFISKKMGSITEFLGTFNEAEEKFWKEGLVCGNNQNRYLENSQYVNPNYDISTQKCCRETSKKFTYYTAYNNDLSMRVIASDKSPLVPGVNQDINDPTRYTSNQIVYDKLIQEPNKYKPLYTAGPIQNGGGSSVTISDYLGQFNTLQKHNERMCCSQHWVRSFASGENGNGGGHKFSPTKQQNRNPEDLVRLNWLPMIYAANPTDLLSDFYNNIPAGYLASPLSEQVPFSCTLDNVETIACEAQNIAKGSALEKRWLDYFSRFELIGIPQILIPTNQYREPGATRPSFVPLVGESQEDITTSTDPLPLPGTVKKVGPLNQPEIIDGTKSYYSAANMLQFDTSKVKKVFSENEFNCCLPTGYEVPPGTTDDMCCSGKVGGNQDGGYRCVLEDFADLSVYTNAYVSSEGYNNINIQVLSSDIDQETGYIRKEKVMQMAANMCQSGIGSYGYAITELYVPIEGQGNYNPNYKKRRFVDNDQIDADSSVNAAYQRFMAGARWNNHVYCAPEGFTEPLNGGGSGSGGNGSGSTGQ